MRASGVPSLDSWPGKPTLIAFANDSSPNGGLHVASFTYTGPGGLTLIALYGPDSPFGVHLAFTRGAVFVALLFVTLPFVVRSVQPVLIALDHEVEEAAASLGASNMKKKTKRSLGKERFSRSRTTGRGGRAYGISMTGRSVRRLNPSATKRVGTQISSKR